MKGESGLLFARRGLEGSATFGVTGTKLEFISFFLCIVVGNEYQLCPISRTSNADLQQSASYWC